MCVSRLGKKVDLVGGGDVLDVAILQKFGSLFHRFIFLCVWLMMVEVFIFGIVVWFLASLTFLLKGVSVASTPVRENIFSHWHGGTQKNKGLRASLTGAYTSLLYLPRFTDKVGHQKVLLSSKRAIKNPLLTFRLCYRIMSMRVSHWFLSHICYVLLGSVLVHHMNSKFGYYKAQMVVLPVWTFMQTVFFFHGVFWYFPLPSAEKVMPQVRWQLSQMD